jgi:hypothetical protein
VKEERWRKGCLGRKEGGREELSCEVGKMKEGRVGRKEGGWKNSHVK